MTFKAFALSFLGAALFTAVVAVPTTAHSTWIRRNALGGCVPNPGSDSNLSQDTNGALQNTAASDVIVFCDIGADDRFPASSTVTMNLHGYNGGATYVLAAYACVAYYGTNGGGLCDSNSQSSGSGDVQLSVTHSSSWTVGHDADFAYLWITIPRVQGGVDSTIRGWYRSS